MSYKDVERECIVCGTKFFPHAFNQLTCSPECSRINSNILCGQRRRAERNAKLGLVEPLRDERGHIIIERDTTHKHGGWFTNCIVCGKQFKTYSARKITCSDECYSEYRRTLNGVIEEKPHINTMPDLIAIAKRGINYGQMVAEMERNKYK